MRAFAFAKRNLKEILRDPLSLAFNIGLPVGLLLVFRLLFMGMSEEDFSHVPQFTIERLAPSLAVFSFSFLTLFASLLVSKDRTTSFLARLRTSPLTATDFLLGYTLPMLPIALAQVVLMYGISAIFGLKITLELLLSILTMIPIAFLFIACGVLFGTLFSDKAVGGVCSIMIQVCALFSGMFMPLETLNKTVQTIAYIFPFANTLKVTQAVITNDYNNILLNVIIVLGYTIVVCVISVIVFRKKLNSDKN